MTALAGCAGLATFALWPRGYRVALGRGRRCPASLRYRGPRRRRRDRRHHRCTLYAAALGQHRHAPAPAAAPIARTSPTSSAPRRSACSGDSAQPPDAVRRRCAPAPPSTPPTTPSVVRRLRRPRASHETVQGQVALPRYMGPTPTARSGYRRRRRGARLTPAHPTAPRFVPAPLDGYSVAQKIGGAVRSMRGYPHHIGGGRAGSRRCFVLSNNARPFPQIGIERDETSAFQSPWLSWLGPWQAEFLVGLALDDSRVAVNTIYTGLQVSPSIRCRASRSAWRAPPRCAVRGIPACRCAIISISRTTTTPSITPTTKA